MSSKQMVPCCGAVGALLISIASCSAAQGDRLDRSALGLSFSEEFDAPLSWCSENCRGERWGRSISIAVRHPCRGDWACTSLRAKSSSTRTTLASESTLSRYPAAFSTLRCDLRHPNAGGGQRRMAGHGGRAKKGGTVYRRHVEQRDQLPAALWIFRSARESAGDDGRMACLLATRTTGNL